jgi:hypothetical protein
MKMILKYCLLFFALFVSNYANAQSTSPRQEYFESKINERKFDETKWEELVKDFDYSEALFEDYDEAFDTTQTNPNTNKVSPSGRSNSFGSAFWASFFQILFIIIVALVIVVLLINMLGAGDIFAPRSRKISKYSNTFSIEKIEENIHETDLEKFIQKAVQEKNYALAIRLYYLAIIKELSLSKMIKWKRDKTNRTYLREVGSSNLFKPFRETTRIFERVWYGEGKLDEQEYFSLKPKFEQLIKAVKAKAAALEID